MTSTWSEERTARAVLSWLCEPGDALLRQLLAEDGPVETYERLRAGEAPFVPRVELRHGGPARWWPDADAAVERAQRGGVRVIIPADPDWPAGLHDLDIGEPVCLWARGPARLPAQASAVAVVGARACTGYGEIVAADLAGQLADRHWTVLSSGGLGIDGVAVHAALAVDGDAVAVLPGGLDRLHPPHHRDLFDRLAGDGLLLSAWPPDARPTRHRMLANTGLLAALTAGTVLVEASLRSRAAQVVRQAVDLARVGMVVPGPVMSAMSAGCHALLRSDPRVRPVATAVDVLADLTRPAATGGDDR